MQSSHAARALPCQLTAEMVLLETSVFHKHSAAELAGLCSWCTRPSRGELGGRPSGDPQSRQQESPRPFQQQLQRAALRAACFSTAAEAPSFSSVEA